MEQKYTTRKKKVRFNRDNGEQFTLGEVKKRLSKRCITYLVHVVQKSVKIVLDIKDTLVM